jgi:hypothetical protein
LALQVSYARMIIYHFRLGDPRKIHHTWAANIKHLKLIFLSTNYKFYQMNISDAPFWWPRCLRISSINEPRGWAHRTSSENPPLLAAQQFSGGGGGAILPEEPLKNVSEFNYRACQETEKQGRTASWARHSSDFGTPHRNCLPQTIPPRWRHRQEPASSKANPPHRHLRIHFIGPWRLMIGPIYLNRVLKILNW